MIRQADYDVAHAELTDEQADAIVREWLHDEPELRAELLAPPRDAVSDMDDELPCYPPAYSDMTPRPDDHPNAGVGIGVALLFASCMGFGVWAIVEQMREML